MPTVGFESKAPSRSSFTHRRLDRSITAGWNVIEPDARQCWRRRLAHPSTSRSNLRRLRRPPTASRSRRSPHCRRRGAPATRPASSCWPRAWARPGSPPSIQRVKERRVLFVAHREEILDQALATFRRIRPSASLGVYTGQTKEADADVLFASIQTLGRLRHLRAFSAQAFDYVVVDEFHHAAAATYRRLIDHFEPKFLLGLTATPERTDGGDLLALCQENLVYRCDLARGHSSGAALPVPLLRRARRRRLPQHPLAEQPLRRGGADARPSPPRSAPRTSSSSTEARRRAHARLLLLAAARRLHGGVLPRTRRPVPSRFTPGPSVRPAGRVPGAAGSRASSTSSSPSTCSTRASTSRRSTP